jgi:spermidine/putrescine transport system substrate-binding protein
MKLPSFGSTNSAPYDWGTTGIAYNTDCIQPEEESWALLLDSRIAGRVAMDSDSVLVIALSLKHLGFPLNSRDAAEFGEAIAWLETLRASNGLEFLVWNDILERLVAGDLCAGTAYNGDAAFYMAESDNLAFFVPTEGSDFYVDSMAVPRDARNKLQAEMFINYILRPDVHAANTDYTGYAVPNRASVDGGYVGDEILADKVRYPDTSTLEAWEPHDREMRSLWNEAWASFMHNVR